MKKPYIKPVVSINLTVDGAVPAALAVSPLAFFSTATAAAGVAATAVGAIVGGLAVAAIGKVALVNHSSIMRKDKPLNLHIY